MDYKKYRSWAHPARERNKALDLSRGCYQSSLICGSSAVSGADLRGKAQRYAGHYASSRASVFTRLNDHDVVYAVVARKRGKLSLVYGELPLYVWELRLHAPQEMRREIGELAFTISYKMINGESVARQVTKITKLEGLLELYRLRDLAI